MNQDDLRLEDEIRSMFAHRSEQVRPSYSPYRAVAQRISRARRRRRQRVGGSMFAAVVVAAGVGAWAFQGTGQRSAPPAGTGGLEPIGTATFEYSDQSAIPVGTGDAAAMRKAATDYLASVGRGGLAGAGHTVVTTFDPSMMAAAKSTGDAMAAQVAHLPNDDRLAFATVDSRTGFVKAFYGGSDAFSAKLEVGQLMFPVTLAAALDYQDLYTAASKEPATDSKVLYYPIGSTKESDRIAYVDADGQTRNWPPPNADQDSKSLGATATLAQGVQWSVSSVFTDLELEPEVTPQLVYTTAKAVGVPESVEDFNPIPSLTLGTFEASPVRMAAVYGTFADAGVRRDPVTVAEVLDAAGHVVWKPDTAGGTGLQRATTAAVVTQTLKLAATQGTGKGNHALAQYAAGHPGLAGKTSTADLGAAWFTGYDGDLVTSVAVYKLVTAEPSGRAIIGSDVQGNGIPATVWAEYTEAVGS